MEAKCDVRAISKNVMQHGQIYPKTGPSELCNLKWCLELNKLCDITPKLGRQQKREAAQTDIAQNRAAGWLQKQSRQQKRERRGENDGYEKQSKTLGFLDEEC